MNDINPITHNREGISEGQISRPNIVVIVTGKHSHWLMANVEKSFALAIYWCEWPFGYVHSVGDIEFDVRKCHDSNG